MTKNLKKTFLEAEIFQAGILSIKKAAKGIALTETNLTDAYLGHGLKMFITKMEKVLADKLKDPTQFFRKKTVEVCCGLAKEFELLDNNIFLKLIINKLGDQDEKIVGSLLKTLDIVMNKNANLAGKIQKEVQVLLNRSNLPERVKFMAYTLLANVDYSKVTDQRVCSNSLTLFCKESQGLLREYEDERDSKM
jgi:hypothetical protein